MSEHKTRVLVIEIPILEIPESLPRLRTYCWNGSPGECLEQILEKIDAVTSRFAEKLVAIRGELDPSRCRIEERPRQVVEHDCASQAAKAVESERQRIIELCMEQYVYWRDVDEASAYHSRSICVGAACAASNILAGVMAKPMVKDGG